MAERERAIVGVNVTLIVQLPPLATVLPQLFVSAKLPVLAPVIDMPLMVIVLTPLLARVTVWDSLGVFRGWELNCRLPGERVTGGIPSCNIPKYPPRLLSR